MAALVMRRVKDKVVVQLPSKREIALDPKCMVTVGKFAFNDRHSLRNHLLPL